MEDILKRVVEILNKIKNQPDKYISENYTKELTGLYFNFDEVDLVYLFLEIKHEFSINFTVEEIASEEFLTISGLGSLICRKLNI